MDTKKAEKGKVLYRVQRRGSVRYPKYDVWPFVDLDNGNFQQIGLDGPEGSFDNYSDASRFCSELNQKEKVK